LPLGNYSADSVFGFSTTFYVSSTYIDVFPFISSVCLILLSGLFGISGFSSLHLFHDPRFPGDFGCIYPGFCPGSHVYKGFYSFYTTFLGGGSFISSS